MSSTILSANCGHIVLYLSKLQNHYSLGYFGIQPHLANAFSSVNVTNQIFIIKHNPFAPGWRVSRTSVAMGTCTRVGHNFCNSHGLLLSFMSTYELVLMHLYTCKSLRNILGRVVEQLAGCLTKQSKSQQLRSKYNTCNASANAL